MFENPILQFLKELIDLSEEERIIQYGTGYREVWANLALEELERQLAKAKTDN